MLDLIVRLSGYLGLGALTITVVVAVVWQFFKWFGAKWIEGRFAKSLKQFEHHQNQEIERLRGDIARLLDRATKLHAREFEVLPVAWDLLSQAMARCLDVLDRSQSYNDVSKLTSEELEAFLSGTTFREYEKQRIRDAERDKKLDVYVGLNNDHRLAEAFNAARELHNHVLRNAIFIQPDLLAKFQRMALLMWTAVQDERMVRTEGLERKYAEGSRDGVFNDGQPLQQEIRADIFSRLWAELPTAPGEV